MAWLTVSCIDKNDQKQSYDENCQNCSDYTKCIFENSNLIYEMTEEENKKLFDAAKRQARLNVTLMNNNRSPHDIEKSINAQTEILFFDTKRKLKSCQEVLKNSEENTGVKEEG